MAITVSQPVSATVETKVLDEEAGNLVERVYAHLHSIFGRVAHLLHR